MKCPDCPECDKIAKHKEASQRIGEFLEWLQEEVKFKICVNDNEAGIYYPVCESIEQLLARYFNIDLSKVEDERRALLEWSRKVNQK